MNCLHILRGKKLFKKFFSRLCEAEKTDSRLFCNGNSMNHSSKNAKITRLQAAKIDPLIEAKWCFISDRSRGPYLIVTKIYAP